MSGAQAYAANCASCHQANGQGAAGAFPPLAGSDIVAGDPAKMIHVVKYGLTGPVEIAGKTYNGQMPAWSPQINDANIASVITYVRSSWGNHATAVTPSEVTAVTNAGDQH
jgi:mono/diheme cytochrome c family protein